MVTPAPSIPKRCPQCGSLIEQRRHRTSPYVQWVCVQCWYQAAKMRVAEARAAGILAEFPAACRKHHLPRTYTLANGRPGCSTCVTEQDVEDD